MMAFQTTKKFFGEKYFPYGIARSGDFSKKQVALLENHGTKYEALYKGEIEPATQEEEDFVVFCRGEKPPESEHEKVWALFLKKINSRVTVSAFGSIAAPTEDDEELLVDDDDADFDDD